MFGTSASADDYKPSIHPASDEGEKAISGFKVPQGMQVSLFAAEPQLANPVAFGIDEQGRIYVCETFRQQKGVEDNRSHMNWLEDDLALNSVSERIEMFRKFLGESVLDYTREQDRIRLLIDTDGDGKADRDTIFASGFNAIEDGTGAGVLAVDGDVYYTCIPKLWKFRDEDGDGVAEVEQVLHDGYGVRVAFRGHDMHGLVLGPDGRIYFSIGDRGYNVLTSEGQQLVRPDTGAVFRCERDGSQLEVFAYGLRNPQELAFDEFGNLFTGDNNSDSGDKARWVNVVEGGDTGWRMYYQYLSDRGPWNRERIWYPYRADDETTRVQPANTLPPIAHLGDGPSGLTYYPGVGLPERYKGHFFMADFRGSAGNSGIRSFAVNPKGATFELVDSDWFLQSILATDVDFGYDGKMYVTDWVDGWNGPGKGRIYTFALPEAANASDVAVLFKEGFRKRSAKELSQLLTHADYRVRLRAQLALVDQKAITDLQQIAVSKAATTPRIHAIWGLGILHRRGVATSDTLLSLLKDNAPEIRTQAASVAGDARIATAAPRLIEMISGGTPREQAYAAIALGKLKTEAAIPALISLLEQNADRDPVVRHAAVMGLLGCATTEQLTAQEKHPSAAVRLGLVLALRRQQSAEVARFLNDGEDRIVEEAARAIHDEPIAEALPQLAKLATRAGMSDLLQRRVMNANFRLGGEDRAVAIADMAANGQLAEHLRLEAIQELMDWAAPPRLDRVTNQFRPIPSRSADEAREAVRRSLGSMLSGSDKLREKAIGLAGKYGIQDVGPELAKMFRNTELPGAVRVEALSALGVLKSAELSDLVKVALNDEQPTIRSEGRRQLATLNPGRAIDEFAKVLQSGSPAEQQAAITVLTTMKSEPADAVLLRQLDVLQQGQAAPETALDLLNAAQERGTPALKEAVARFDSSRNATNPLDLFRECLAGGDAERGRDIFFGNAAASCRRCHKVNGNGGEVGPDLSAVAKEKNRDYLLESIVSPNAKIAKGFETTVFALDDGRVVAGIVRSEDDTAYRVVTPTGEVLTIEKASVEESIKGKSGMPEDLVKQLSKSQIRDLVEYLSTLKTPLSAEGHAN